MRSFFVNLVQSVHATYWYFLARIQFLLRRVNWPKNLRVLGPLGLSASGRILIGENVTILGDSKFNRAGINHPTQLVAGPSAELTIGDNTGISGASIYAVQRIEIGNHVLIGANCHIYDTDFHPMDWQQRRVSSRPETSPIRIYIFFTRRTGDWSDPCGLQAYKSNGKI